MKTIRQGTSDPSELKVTVTGNISKEMERQQVLIMMLHLSILKHLRAMKKEGGCNNQTLFNVDETNLFW